MRFLGVRVDTQRAYDLRKELIGQEQLLLQEIRKETQIDTQIWGSKIDRKSFSKTKPILRAYCKIW